MNKLLLSVALLMAMCNIYATTWTITNSGTTFTPDLITITLGDTVVFQLEGQHNAQEVSQADWNANNNSPIIGFQTNFGGGEVTGLTGGTHYYVCSPHASMGMKGRIIVNTPPPVVIPNVWINELHYDNSGTDSNEGFEVAGPSGTDLSCYKVYFYNGSNGQVYDSVALSGFLPFQACQWGTKWYGGATGYLQNGNPDGIALVYAPQLTGCGMSGVDTVLQFLSYGGTFTATNGRLNGQTSVDIGVSESSSTLATESIQLTGRGNRYSEFTWVNDTASTHDNVNVGQNFCGIQHLILLPATASVNEGAGSITIPVLLDTASQYGTQVTLSLVTGFGTATQGTDFTFSDVVLTWPAGTTGYVQATVPILNDNLFEINETFKLVLRNPTNGALLTADSMQVITIIDNDPLSGADCSDLYFSEYIEGSGNNQALEIYNPTANTINLADYSIVKTTDGGASTTYNLSGVLTAGDVLVLVNPAASNSNIVAQADVFDSFFNFDGNDGFALLHLNDTIDVIGYLGVIINGGWTVGIGSTQNNTLIRSYYQYNGNDNWLTAATEYDVYATDMTDSLGMHHTAPCGTVPPPPPAYLSFEWVSDTVPEGDTTMYFAVRFVNPSNVQYSYAIAYDAAQSTAANNIDGNYANQTITHGQGTFIDTFSIIVFDDPLIEATENFYLRFINLPANVYPTQDSIYNLHITDADVLNVSFIGAGLTYTEGVGLAEVKLVISTPVDSATMVNVSLAAGNATSNVDFIFNDTTIVFPHNTNDTQSVWVTIIDDNIDEGNEQINFNLTNATNGANILISAFTLTIIDNDSTIIGINDVNAKDGIKVYPNPAINTLNLQSDAILQRVVITDVIGNVVLQQDALAAGKNRLDITALPAGMYVVAVHAGDKVITRKFIKAE